MKLLFYCIILQIFQTATSFNKSLDDEMNMILDIINSDHKPTSLAINVCWNLALKRKFIVKLKRLPKAFQFIESVEDVKETLVKNDLLILIDVSCGKSTVFLEKADALKMFGAPYRWLIIATKLTTLNDVTLTIKNLNIPINSEIILPVKDNNGFTIRVPYKIKANSSEVKWEYYGIWTPRQRLKMARRMIIPISMRRKDLGRLPIARSIVLTDNSSSTQLNSMKNIHIDTLSKVNYRQITPLYDFMNATNVIIFRETWGYLINETWNGMIGSLVRGEADIAGTVTFLTTQRLQVLDYLSYPSPPTAKFVFREPSLSYANNLFLLPFKPMVWISILVLIIILAVILFINAKWEKEKMMITQSHETVNETNLRPNISDIAIMIIGAISQQGSSTELKGTLGRVVMFLLFIAFVFLYTSYSANIVVLLQSTSNQIRTLADLYNSKLELGSEDTPYNRHLFSTAKEPIRMAIYKNKIAPRGGKSNFMLLDEGVKKLQTEPFAFNMFLGTGYKAIENYFYEHEKCGLQEIEYIQENKPWQACRKHSPYKEVYKIGLLRIQEHGLNDRENRRVFGKKPVCSVRGGSFGSVNMMDFYPALLMLLYGMILSGILLIFEILHQRRTRFPILH